jgi:hypothetical protein
MLLNFRCLILYLVLCLSAGILIFDSAAFAAGAKTESAIPAHFSLTESTVMVGYGSGGLPSKNYEPILMLWHLGYDLKGLFKDLPKYGGTLTGFLEPQINPVFRPEKDVEFGVGIGLKYMHPLTKALSGYVMASVGPYFITLQTQEQVNGFIFFDTASLGLSFFLTPKSAVDLEYRFRHMSNGGIRQPNDGINVNMVAIGYTLFF